MKIVCGNIILPQGGGYFLSSPRHANRGSRQERRARVMLKPFEKNGAAITLVIVAEMDLCGIAIPMQKTA
jgi:hypothetical protein